MPPLNLKTGLVEMNHGSGGRASAELIAKIFFRHFAHPALLAQGDGAVLPLPTPAERLVMATDSHVVTPLFFPGGDIGALSVHGTLNDVAMMGGTPLALSASFILEEGFPLGMLDRIAASMGQAAHSAGVPIVTGDTKVVERGKADGVFITTTGVGICPQHLNLGGTQIRLGDKILLSGPIGLHGVAILSQRENLGFETEICSDSAPLHTLVAHMLSHVPSVHALRDPTRGGVAAVLNEFAQQSGYGMQIQENAIIVPDAVRSACELLGLDPLYIANEGKLLAFCPAHDAEHLLAVMRSHPQGREASIIGEVIEDPLHLVRMTTPFGGQRRVDWLAGEQLPRIC